ncbi:LysR substrate-binding domain-containing protein [Lapidilactobacillus mulanensis]|uniref:LysR substrate-binding domain-containing protein n=1 Tax=Lapidilactobacillus mulanensis TaxID=2485999 RepID=A0ABW4DQD3_9LACO|nr:LysR family transcriptional regulator [Lapidilactobacillus mulanensis]
MKTRQENLFASKTLTYFLQLAETMNYTQAAQILGITQPALTQQIKKLERTVGAPVFFSIGKKLYLSDAGRTMLTTTQNIFGMVNEALDQVQQSTGPSNGPINIGFLSSMEDGAFEDFFIYFTEKYPDIKIRFTLLTRREIWDQLESNQIDLAVMYVPDESIKNWRSYETKKILTDHLVYLHHDEKLAERKKVKLQATNKSDWVTYPPDHFIAQLLGEVYKNKMVDEPTVKSQFTSPYQIVKFAEARGLSTALPYSFWLAHQDQIKMYHADFDPIVSFDMSFVYRHDKSKIPRIERFFQEWDDFFKEKDYLTVISDTRII